MYTGIAQGIQPLVSRYYGRKEEGNIHRALRYALGTVAVLSAAAYAGIFLGAESVALCQQWKGPRFAGSCCSRAEDLFHGLPVYGDKYRVGLLPCRDRPGQAGGAYLSGGGFFVILPLAFILPKAWGNGIMVCLSCDRAAGLPAGSRAVPAERWGAEWRDAKTPLMNYFSQIIAYK